MKDNFLFGYIFIKVSKPLAILSLVAGMVLSAVLILQWNKQVKDFSYKNNPELIKNLSGLLRDYGQTKNKVMQLHSQLMTNTEEDVKLYLDPEVYESYTTIEHFADLKVQLQSIGKNSEIFKGLVFKNFSESVNFLLEKMREYALLKKWISEMPKAEEAKEEPEQLDFYLISSPAESYERNIDLLKKSIDYLNGLKKSVENPESKINIDTMLNHLSQYQNIMRKVNVALVDKDSEGSEEETGNKKRIFVIMDELELMKKNIQEAATSNWTVDDAFAKSMQLVAQESVKCQDAKVLVQKLHFDNGIRLIVVIVLTLLLSAGILILSDVFNALFRMALKE